MLSRRQFEILLEACTLRLLRPYDEQSRGVYAESGANLFIVAGPGTGKTSCLTMLPSQIGCFRTYISSDRTPILQTSSRRWRWSERASDMARGSGSSREPERYNDRRRNDDRNDGALWWATPRHRGREAMGPRSRRRSTAKDSSVRTCSSDRDRTVDLAGLPPWLSLNESRRFVFVPRRAGSVSRWGSRWRGSVGFWLWRIRKP
jgi:hypothetical protein